MKKIIIQIFLFTLLYPAMTHALTINIDIITGYNSEGDLFVYQKISKSGKDITEIPLDTDGTIDYFSIIDLHVTNKDLSNSINYFYGFRTGGRYPTDTFPSYNLITATSDYTEGLLGPGESITVEAIYAANWNYVQTSSSGYYTAPAKPGDSVTLGTYDRDGDFIWYEIYPAHGGAGEVDWFSIEGAGAIVVTNHTPEPSTLLLFGIGISGMAAMGRRKS